MITVSENKRFLKKDGKPYFYLADTAWTLLQRLSGEEMSYYLDCRAKQGFNAIQVSAVSELDGLRVPNREGQLPFKNANPLFPNKAYFKQLIFLAQECQKRDLVLTVLPYWGNLFNQKWGVGPQVLTPENAFSYASFLSRLLAPFENIIWMLGGDRPIESDYHRLIIEETVAGLKAVKGVPKLVTYHPCGEMSSVSFSSITEHLDFHSLQSGHSFGGFKSEKMVLKTLKIGRKPCLDAECFYEDFPLDFDTDWEYRFTPQDIRRRLYKNLFCGALGAVYGHQSVWCFREETDREYLFSWRQALDRPMANQVRHLAALIDRLDFTRFAKTNTAFGALSCLMGDTELIYLENTEPVFLHLKPEKHLKNAFWFDPETGEISPFPHPVRDKLAVVSPFRHDAILMLCPDPLDM